ncbi:MAG TPA: GFA family protein [Sphingomonadaceae bacterium]|nr:GFA family protein [Sphingomonadaceae bacterium]
MGEDAGSTMEGGCLCGAVRYRLSGAPAFVSQCCCKDCQKATGTGHTTIIGIHRDQLAITGPVKEYTNRGDTGGEVTRHFCDTCGGRIFTSGTLPGTTIMVQAGSLDDPGQVSPTSVIYTKDAVAWDFFDPKLPKFEAMQPRSNHVRPG